MSHRRVILLCCCLLGACKREDASSAAQQAAKSSAREHAGKGEGSTGDHASKSGDSAREAQIQAEERAASKDPDLQKLLQAAQELMKDAQFDAFGQPRNVDRRAIARLYGSRYPLAGLRWLPQQGLESKSLWSEFAKAWYASDPKAASAMLDQLPLMTREGFADGLCEVADAADRQGLWEILDRNDLNFTQPLALKGALVRNQAKSDPEAAWLRAREEFGPSYDEKNFLESLPKLDPGTPYPASFLDRVPPDQLGEVIHTGLSRSRSRANVEPLAQWTADQATSPQMEIVYEDIASWEHGFGNPAKAKEWIDKIPDPARRENAMRALSAGAAD